MSPFRMAFLHLVRRSTASIITILAIASAVGCGGLLVRLYILSNSRFSTIVHGPDAVIGAKAGGIEILLGSLNLEGGYPEFIPSQLYRTLKERQQIRFENGAVFDPSTLRSVVPIVYFAWFRNHRVIGTDEEFIRQPSSPDSPRLASGRWFGPGNEVVIGSGVASGEHVAVGDSIDLVAWTGDSRQAGLVTRALVTGVLQERRCAWDRACFSSIAAAVRMFKESHLDSATTWRRDVLHYLLVYFRPGGFKALSELIDRRTVAEVISVQEQSRRLEALTGTGLDLSLALTVLVLVLGGLSVAAVMITRFEAMTVQLAVLRALGYTRKEIGEWLLWEGLILGGTACLIGAAGDAAAFPHLRAALGAAIPSPEIVTSPMYYSAPVWAASLCGTILAVSIPFFRLYRQDVHSALIGV